ncbi:hypothetical protein CH275_15970 [Rhodococcus sp. 06-235-1A]|uniref:hypothetical protein n=1 Tax=Rhodococcus sp. 06-235-1A TaxID=2022508 RepID=UPI000B9BE058|nr:hypothetical protein [Rhodococcus sp. 06-235-1A]OZD03886.1 hypothetical protein CH275_15970 [Rhodococcus sp. 06-235-1A]
MVNVRNSFVATPPIDGGVVHSAALGEAEFPETALTALDPIFKANDHGALSDSGLSLNKARSTQKVRMFGGATFREPQTEYDETLTFAFLEDDNIAVLNSVFGEANVEVETATANGQHKTIYHTSEQLPIRHWIATVIDGVKTKRYLIEHGQVTTTAEVVDVHSNVTTHQVTLTTYASTNPDFKGAHVVELRHDGSIVAVAGGNLVQGMQLRAASVDESGEPVALDAPDSATTSDSDEAPDTAKAATTDTTGSAQAASVDPAVAEPNSTSSAPAPTTTTATAPKTATAKSTSTSSK